MTNPLKKVDGAARWIGIAVMVAIALGTMWQHTAATQAELRERMTAVEAVIPRIDAKLKTLEAGQRAIGMLLMERLPK